MKKFSDVRQLSEDSDGYFGPGYRTGPLDGDNSVDTPDIGIFDVSNPEAIDRINAFLGSAAARPVIDPWSVLRQVHKKLSMIGLQFKIPPAAIKGRNFNAPSGPIKHGKNWTEEYQLTYLGGRFGVLDNQYTIGYDDNIKHRAGYGLTLKIEYTVQSTGMTTVIPHIEPNTSS